MTSVARKLVIAAIALSSVGACGSPFRPVFLRPALDLQAYSAEFEACEAVAEEDSRSTLERSGIADAGWLLYPHQHRWARKREFRREFEQCMFFRGYSLIALPEGFGTNPRNDDDEFDYRKAGTTLVEEGKAEELLVWENAKNSGSAERLRRYLGMYPDGHFAAQARERLAAGVGPAGDKPK